MSGAPRLAAALAAGLAAFIVPGRFAVDAQPSASLDALAARIDPYVEKPRASS